MTLAHGPSILIAATAATKSSGSACLSTRPRKVRLGSAPETTVPAASSVPSSSTTPRARPPSTRIDAAPAPVRISMPWLRPAAAIAAVIDPMPPITCPKKPCTSSSPPVSRWNSSPDNVPGVYGPPCLP